MRATQEMTRNMIAWHEAINFLQLLLVMGMSTVLINEEKDKGLLCRNNGSTMNRKRWWERRRLARKKMSVSRKSRSLKLSRL